MTHWRDPRFVETPEAPTEAQISNFRMAWLTFTVALLLGAIACVSWGFS